MSTWIIAGLIALAAGLALVPAETDEVQCASGCCQECAPGCCEACPPDCCDECPPEGCPPGCCEGACADATCCGEAD